ncbi:hypothetical protein B0I35DRAFT_400412 [Stachybotrys elegans]|uniref:FAD-binding PCMH-type domain-containing protein n=1 Tax=Stachybotrys elegans TaxID=80388 RepID=A0A8K0SFS8_9HYPO|nr:hypothetical protein B0I35DRAFT_400412 [Stachybotrys elegans]
MARKLLSLVAFLRILRLAACQGAGACETLELALPGKVVYRGTEAYDASNVFWSARQSNLKPACFALPESADDVSVIIAQLTATNSTFTVKAGGHTAFPGSNIQDGVTIDLGLMNTISLSEDSQSASLGPGARWEDVARFLDPLGLAVVGGRSPTVGVAGLILGGGISFLSGRRGWACDNVLNFEVVLGSGEVVNANPQQNRDLYWALRGGGGANFGIVTRFDVNAYPQGDLWSRITTWPYTQRLPVLLTFANISRDILHVDKDAHIFYHLAHVDGVDDPFVVTFAFHSDLETPPIETPSTFEALASLPDQLSNSTVITTLGGQLELLRDTNGGRRTFLVTSISDGPGGDQLLEDITTQWRRSSDTIRDIAHQRNKTVSSSLTVQPITHPTLQIMQRNGGNPLGLESNHESLVFIVHVLIAWEDSSLDRAIESEWEAFFKTVDEMADAAGLANGYKYMNYGGQSQDVYGSYGAENLERLRNVARVYDPDGALAKLWQGYFKL